MVWTYKMQSISAQKIISSCITSKVKVDKRHVLKPKTKINANINHLTELLLVVGQQMNY